MVLAIIIAFWVGGSLGFFMACLLCSSRTTERNHPSPQRFYRAPLQRVSGKFLAN
jgi:hypothetical protein